MRLSLPLPRLATLAALLASRPRGVAAGPGLEALDAALLEDLLEGYADHDAGDRPAECLPSTENAAATTFSFDWPGTNAAAGWKPAFEGFEEALFQTEMSHADAAPGKNSWTIRIGTGGNIYSHYAPDRHGETFPPQNHAQAPWIDEVQQTVAVNGELQQGAAYRHPEYCTGNPANGGVCRPYYIHQAGAYQRHAPFTDVPFFSPSLARRCADNWCAFASWGTQAHVPTPFTSPVVYVNRYANCGGGVIEHTQIIHK